MAASLCFKSFEDHSLLKGYNGGLGPKEEYQVCYVGFLGCYVFDLYYVFDA